MIEVELHPRSPDCLPRTFPAAPHPSLSSSMQVMSDWSEEGTKVVLAALLGWGRGFGHRLSWKRCLQKGSAKAKELTSNPEPPEREPHSRKPAPALDSSAGVSATPPRSHPLGSLSRAREDERFSGYKGERGTRGTSVGWVFAREKLSSGKQEARQGQEVPQL